MIAIISYVDPIKCKVISYTFIHVLFISYSPYLCRIHHHVYIICTIDQPVKRIDNVVIEVLKCA